MKKKSVTVVPVESMAKAATESKELTPRSPEMAAEAAKVIDLIAERLELETPHPATAKRVRGARTVPRDFVVSMIAAAERMPAFPTLQGFDLAEAREVLESADAYRIVSERTALFLARVNYTIEARWAAVAANAMKIFSMWSIMAENPENAEVAAEVENLRRLLGRKGPRKKKAKNGKV